MAALPSHRHEAAPRRGSLTDVRPLRVGHHTEHRRPTGCTVVLCGREGAVAGVDVRGAAPGTRETDLLHPLNTIDRVHALVLAGGSAFGLDAASGVVAWLEERRIGVPVGPACVPIVPAAILFDLWMGDGSIRPDAQAGRQACEAAASALGDGPVPVGCVGAGTGCSVGKLLGAHRAMKGGIGSASVQVQGVTVAALIAVNAVGDVIDPGSGEVLAGARGDDGRPLRIRDRLLAGEPLFGALPGGATTIGTVATDARLDKAEASLLARMAHDGLARTIDPVHTPYDGDTLFALATGTAPADPPRPPLAVLGTAAAHVTALAVIDAIRSAHTLDGHADCPAWADRPWTGRTA